MDFCKSLRDITFLKENMATLIVPNHCPITLSPALEEISQSLLTTTGNQAASSIPTLGRICRLLFAEKMMDDLGRHVISYFVLSFFRPNCTKPQNHRVPHDRCH